MQNIKNYLRINWQFFFNIYIFLNIAGFAGWQTYSTWKAGLLDFVEISFAAQNVIMLAFILIRRKHKAVNLNFSHQLVALFAFFSGLLFIGINKTGGEVATEISSGIIFVSNILGAVTLLNLGRSFGILIALRKVKTGGLYSFVRHPMYGTDIMLRIGFLISHFTPFTIFLFTFSTGAYIYRAILEERFLKQDPEYKIYMEKVKYRFIPFVF